MKHLTVRNIPSDVAAALEQEKKHRGLSLNQTVLDLLQQALNVGSSHAPTNGLEQLAGTWSDAEFEQFETAVECFEQIDDELWP